MRLPSTILAVFVSAVACAAAVLSTLPVVEWPDCEAATNATSADSRTSASPSITRETTERRAKAIVGVPGLTIATIFAKLPLAPLGNYALERKARQKTWQNTLIQRQP